MPHPVNGQLHAGWQPAASASLRARNNTAVGLGCAAKVRLVTADRNVWPRTLHPKTSRTNSRKNSVMRGSGALSLPPL
jgi:hypothetical protein